MQRIFKRIFPLILCMIFLFSTSSTVFATGDGNIDGGGGGMGGGTATDVWYGQDGVRVTVVTSSGSVVSTPFDLTNSNISNNVINFGRVSKLQYNAGTRLSPAGSYNCSKPGIALPRIVSGSSSRASIEAIKRYFCSEYAAQLISSKTGISFDSLISGDYKLVIEPIAYFIHGGRNYAMTATEAGLYNQMSGGTLRRKMPSLTHQNLPLSIFLESADLGYSVWTGTSSGKVSDDNIISSLGIGIVSYRDVPEIELAAPDYTYRVDTDVISSITLTSSTEVNPDNPASVTFSINGRNYTVNDIVIPAGGSQLVWAKWHTPTTPTTLTIQVSVSGANTAKTSFVAKIISLEENIPPDPLATDTNPHFSTPSLPSNTQKTSASWSVWSASWHANWEWESDWEWERGKHSSSCSVGCTSSHGKWVDNGEWVDNGWYDFTSTSYSAFLGGSMEVSPDDIVPTASGDNMKSGYGVKETANARFSTNAPSSHYAPAQTAVSYFPEFSYDNYWRLLTCNGGNAPTFHFKNNEFSSYNRAVHFSPIWYPNGSYTVYTYIIDMWTPVGMLSINLSDSVQIQGSLYDDWYSKRE